MANYISEDLINEAGTRDVHKLEMTLTKSITGSTLSFLGQITNLENHNFHGYVLVFITENQLIDPNYPTITWNFVFRDYGLNKTLNLPASLTDTYSGSWNIPSAVNVTNIQVIAAAFDADTTNPTYGWPNAVQSVCDTCNHEVAVPEFPTLLWTGILAITWTMAALKLRKRTSSKSKNRNDAKRALSCATAVQQT